MQPSIDYDIQLAGGIKTMFFGGALDWAGLGYASAAATVLILGGLAVFQRVERSFADVV